MAEGSPPSGFGDSSLPEGHLALVVEDAIAALEGSTEPTPPSDFTAVLLYGWAIGATSSAEIAARTASDAGLQHLSVGAPTDAAAIRAFREQQAVSLQREVAAALELLGDSGLDQLGRIPLAAARAEGAEGYARLAHSLLASAAAADVVEGRDATAPILPQDLAARTERQETFRALRERVNEGATGVIPPVTETRRERRQRPVPRAKRTNPLQILMGIVATLLVMFGGLVAIRWLAAGTPTPPAEGRPVAALNQAPAEVEPVETPQPTSDLEARLGSAETPDELQEARDEAMRLARQALEENDLQGAHDFYFLAQQAVPDDDEAADRVRQTELALGIDSRRDDWEEAVSDLSDLRTVAPDSSVVLQAYVTALVGAGRDAILDGDRDHATELCGEALRWFPTREDARSCIVSAGPATPTPEPTGTPTATTTPGRLTAVVVTAIVPTQRPAPPTSTPALGDSTTPEVGGELAVNISASCQPDGSNAGYTLRLTGTVSSASGPVSGYQLVASATPPAGATLGLTNTTYLSPRFQLEQRVTTAGTYSVIARAVKDGYTSGSASGRVTC